MDVEYGGTEHTVPTFFPSGVKNTDVRHLYPERN